MRISYLSTDVCSSDLLATIALVALAVDEHEDARQRPLVLSGKRLDLRRYWAYERRIDEALCQRLAEHEAAPGDLRERLNGLFGPATAAGPIDWQKLACALATRGAFSIITGGTGTGKTTPVVRLLALLQRSEARRVGNESVSTCRSRWSTSH